jgi:uncharacterized protein (TIGR00251 family)
MYYRWEREALYLDCSIQPKPNENRIAGPAAGHLKMRISAAPHNGKENTQLVRFLAKLFHTKQAAITIVSRLTGRHKRVCIKKPLCVPPKLEIPKDTFS